MPAKSGAKFQNFQILRNTMHETPKEGVGELYTPRRVRICVVSKIWKTNLSKIERSKTLSSSTKEQSPKKLESGNTNK